MENNNFGQVKISNDVIATIAGLAALEVEGVEANTTFTDKILKNNGVKIQIEEEEVSLDVMVMIDYGVSIPDIAFKIQENVKNTVETMTGLKVSQVNIHVQGISFRKEKAEKEFGIRELTLSDWKKIYTFDKKENEIIIKSYIADVLNKDIHDIDGKKRDVGVGDVIRIPRGIKHTIIAETAIRLIEVQMGQDIDVKDKQVYELNI